MRIRSKGRQGQTLLEFGIILPLALLLITGLIVFGQIMKAYLLIHNVSREAAREGIVGATNAEIGSLINERAYTLKRENLDYSIEPPNESQRRVGDPLRVTVTYGVPLWIPIYNFILPNPFPVKSVTTMRIEVTPPEGAGGGGGDGGGDSGGDDGGGDDDDDIQPGDFCTQTQGGWGSNPHSVPGKRLYQYFDCVCQGDLDLGNLHFTSAEAVQNFLPAGGPPGTLDKFYKNPTSTSAGVFAGQVTALTLNVLFSAAGYMPQNDPTPLQDLLIARGPMAGVSVWSLMKTAVDALNGETGYQRYGITLSELNDIVTAVNENFVDGKVNKGFLRKP